MDDLRKRASTAVLVAAECRCDDDGDGYTDEWLTNPEQIADAVLSEIGKTHYVIDLVALEEALSDAGHDVDGGWRQVDALLGKGLTNG